MAACHLVFMASSSAEIPVFLFSACNVPGSGCRCTCIRAPRIWGGKFDLNKNNRTEPLVVFPPCYHLLSHPRRGIWVITFGWLSECVGFTGRCTLMRGSDDKDSDKTLQLTKLPMGEHRSNSTPPHNNIHGLPPSGLALTSLRAR